MRCAEHFLVEAKRPRSFPTGELFQRNDLTGRRCDFDAFRSHSVGDIRHYVVQCIWRDVYVEGTSTK